MTLIDADVCKTAHIFFAPLRKQIFYNFVHSMKVEEKKRKGEENVYFFN